MDLMKFNFCDTAIVANIVEWMGNNKKTGNEGGQPKKNERPIRRQRVRLDQEDTMVGFNDNTASFPEHHFGQYEAGP